MTVREILLTRRGVVFVSSVGNPSDATVRAVELELAAIGYVLSTRLRARLAQASLDELDGFRKWACATLLAHKGGNQTHVPLFQKFPADVPHDTETLWWQKVLVHFLQAEGQPCLYCGKVNTTHVLSPCRHVVCDECWDGENYSACPVCEHAVDRSSPFFKPAPDRGTAVEDITFQRLDLATDERAEAKTLFVSSCARTQALSPADRTALAAVLADYRGEVLDWLPAKIPVRENVAAIFGTLFGLCPPADVLPYAQKFMTTATDVLRFVAVLSGQDGSLQPTPPEPRKKSNYRFKVAKLPRALRRTLMTILEGFDGDRLVEDMLRHQSMWVWVGEFLHPGEYKARFPKLMHAFDVVRGEAKAQTWASRVEAALKAQDLPKLVPLLSQRPGDFARRFDHVLRVAGDMAPAVADALAVEKLSTPMLIGLHAHLPRRTKKSAIRVYWPAGKVATGIAATDKRPPLPEELVTRAVDRIDRELLTRFATKPRFGSAIVDEALRTVIVPFNERTASESAVTLPRGTRIQLPNKALIRMFLHWCEPEKKGHDTDLDLSIGFYDAAWTYKDVCSYYQLTAGGGIATSAGDLRSAPFPDGATEFVDLDHVKARGAGYRYAVMVVNAFRGMPFDQLERGFAGIMLRDDPFGAHFDPRTVELKFDLSGESGVYMPLVVDLETDTLHWLDVIAKGEIEFNNVATSNKSITTVCPNLIDYFSSGTRASMYELALLHAAARTDRVFVRGDVIKEFVRRSGETIEAFHTRLVEGEADEPRTRLRTDEPQLAVLYRGDVTLQDGSASYALFREQVTPTLAAADLLV